VNAAPSGVPLRALRAASRSTALPAMQHRIDPVRRLLAAFMSVERAIFQAASLASRAADDVMGRETSA